MAGPSTSSEATMEIDLVKERDNEINKLLTIVEIIMTEIGSVASQKLSHENALLIDIDLSDEVAGFLMTVFTCLRKEENDKPGHNKYLNYSVTIMEQEITVKAIVEKIKSRNININFMIATPIVEIMTAFKAFFDEVRTGVTKFKVRAEVARRTGVKRDKDGKLVPQTQQKDSMHNISMYGLNNQHIPLLQGITLPPERRTGILRSVGPLTQALLLVMENRYYSKLTNALKYSIQMLPMHSEITQCLREASTPGAAAGVLKELGDILLLTTSRATQKVYFPLILIYQLWRLKQAGFQWSFSGSAIIKYYCDWVRTGGRFQIKTSGPTTHIAEAIFHAMFGTYLDDMGVLEEITTNKKWHQRKDLNSVFKDRSKATPKIVVPIAMRYVSKMAQALQTRSLGNIDPCATSRPSFTGMRKRSFTAEFAAYLSTGKTVSSFSSDPIQLHYALKKVKEEVMKDMDSAKLLDTGTKKWDVYNNTTRVWEETEFIPAETGVKFYGKIV